MASETVLIAYCRQGYTLPPQTDMKDAQRLHVQSLKTLTCCALGRRLDICRARERCKKGFKKYATQSDELRQAPRSKLALAHRRRRINRYCSCQPLSVRARWSGLSRGENFGAIPTPNRELTNQHGCPTGLLAEDRTGHSEGELSRSA